MASSMDNPEQVDATWRLAVEPPVARASRLLRHEALPMYYGLNTFEVYLDRRMDYGEGSFKNDVHNALQGLAYWLRRIDAKQRSMIKSLVVCTHVAKVSIAHLMSDNNVGPKKIELSLSKKEVVDETCAANVLAKACLRHYRLEFEV
ncbi:hypothetical protein LTR10_013013 [Elasticomyces elasticus]|nr:hypothetical protein LTR10_013013 [Elasticomyces elasticus]KAK4978566.1 hypothetical protein LTR42_001066 [Elasticomyces elasticus]